MCVCQQVMLTSLPIILYPLFDSDVPKDVAAVSPQLYKPGLTRMHFTRSKMFYWLAEAAYAAVVVTCDLRDWFLKRWFHGLSPGVARWQEPDALGGCRDDGGP